MLEEEAVRTGLGAAAGRGRAVAPAVVVLLLVGCYQSLQNVPDADVPVDVDVAREVDGDASIDGEADARVDVDADGDGAGDSAGDAEVDTAVDAADGGLVECGGGLYDPTSGLCWQDPPPSAAMDWPEAMTYCDALSLAGYGPGSWHLPTIDELRSLIRGCPATEPGGACAVTDPSCLDDFCANEWCDGCSGMWGCYWPEAVSGPCSEYWSSSYHGDRFGVGYFEVHFYYGSVRPTNRPRHARCVRPGP